MSGADCNLIAVTFSCDGVVLNSLTIKVSLRSVSVCLDSVLYLSPARRVVFRRGSGSYFCISFQHGFVKCKLALGRMTTMGRLP